MRTEREWTKLKLYWTGRPHVICGWETQSAVNKGHGKNTHHHHHERWLISYWRWPNKDDSRFAPFDWPRRIWQRIGAGKIEWSDWFFFRRLIFFLSSHVRYTFPLPNGCAECSRRISANLTIPINSMSTLSIRYSHEFVEQKNIKRLFTWFN